MKNKIQKLSFISLKLLLETLQRMIMPPRCALCSQFLKLSEENVCEACEMMLFPPLNAPVDVVVADYSGLIQSAIQDGKFNGETWRLRILGTLLGKAVLKHQFSISEVVPVPSTKNRLRERGYNAAAIIARSCAAKLHVPISYHLQRDQDGPAQHTLSKKERLNVRTAFSCSTQLSGTILIIDDVTTTGHTLGGCVSTLQKAGANHVFSAAVAHTPLNNKS